MGTQRLDDLRQATGEERRPLEAAADCVRAAPGRVVLGEGPLGCRRQRVGRRTRGTRYAASDRRVRVTGGATPTRGGGASDAPHPTCGSCYELDGSGTRRVASIDS